MYISLSRDVNVNIYLVKAPVAKGRRGGSGHRVIYISEYTAGFDRWPEDFRGRESSAVVASVVQPKPDNPAPRR